MTNSSSLSKALAALYGALAAVAAAVVLLGLDQPLCATVAALVAMLGCVAAAWCVRDARRTVGELIGLCAAVGGGQAAASGGIDHAGGELGALRQSIRAIGG